MALAHACNGCQLAVGAAARTGNPHASHTTVLTGVILLAGATPKTTEATYEPAASGRAGSSASSIDQVESQAVWLDKTVRERCRCCPDTTVPMMTGLKDCAVEEERRVRSERLASMEVGALHQLSPVETAESASHPGSHKAIGSNRSRLEMGPQVRPIKRL